MKICMIGLGSIGRRHLGNLTRVLNERGIAYEIDALRSSRMALREEVSSVISRQYYDIDSMPDDYDIIFVTNPTSLHYSTIKNTVAKTKHMFIEKPVFESVSYDIESLILKEQGIYYVACPLRHKSIMKYIKEHIVDHEKIIAARMISTSYLPLWRKDSDYRTTYSAKKSLGGGVTRDLIHEWDYAIYLFGRPDRVVNMRGNISDLEIDSDDISIYMAKFQNMFLEMHLDYIGHKTERILQMFTNDKRIDADLISNTIYEYEGNKLKEKLEFSEEDCYLNEMQYFIECICDGGNNVNTIANALETLKIALA